MDRPELLRMLARLVESGKITTEEAAAIVRAFDAGEITAADLPLPAGESLPVVSAAVAAEVFRRLAARASVRRFGRVVLDRQTLTIPSERARIRISAEIVADYEAARKAQAARSLYKRAQTAASGSAAQEGAREATEAVRATVAAWQKKQADAMRDHLLEQATLGKGAALGADDLARLERVVLEQAAALRGLAEEVAGRAAAGKPMSEKAVAARLGYQDRAYEQYWRFKEEGEAGEEGYVYDYISVDDGGTCSSCLEAEAEGPFLAGQGRFPVASCRGGGHCRCRRERRYAPDEYRRLTGRVAA